MTLTLLTYLPLTSRWPELVSGPPRAARNAGKCHHLSCLMHGSKAVDPFSKGDIGRMDSGDKGKLCPRPRKALPDVIQRRHTDSSFLGNCVEMVYRHIHIYVHLHIYKHIYLYAH